jgi:CheY-like chemotaxis protein/predicted Ser/Thr protein kinase
MTNNKNILFINRDKILLEDLGESLREHGFTVHPANDMRGALSILSMNSVGVIICDNKLQDVTGYEFLRFLKNDPLREKIPFIFLVPINDQGRALNAVKLGASDFIVYPITIEELVSRIQDAVSAPVNADPIRPQTSESITSISPAAVEAEPEKRKSKRIHPLSSVRVDVSRNGVFWLPAQIKNINREGIFLETSLLGKSGTEIFVKVALPSGTSIIKGQVKHIAFKNHDPSAGIGVEVEKNAQWIEILQYIITIIKKTDSPSAAAGSLAGSIMPRANQTQTGPSGDNRNEAKAATPSTAKVKVNPAYEARFYQSLVGKQMDNYKAVSFLGSGAMGGVFEGWDIALERKVALKVISYRLASKESSRNMFIKEARLVSKLDHPNIAHMYHIGNVNEILYFAMEFIDGVTMADMIKKGDKFNTLKGLNYLVTICEALDFVGLNNIIHRDIKPANIMINEKGIVKIVDFGVAKIVDVNGEDNKKEGIVGSPYYISPEAIDGRPLDVRSDIYSLGASFYHAFTGSPPFEGNNAEEVLTKHLEQPLMPLKKKNPKVSPALGRIIERMMEKSPEKRYQDYRHIVKDLKGLESRAQTFQKLKNATLIFKIKPRAEVASL